MDDDKGWRRFRPTKLNKKNFSRRMRKVEGVTLRHAHKFILGRLDSVREVRRHITIWLVGVGVLIALVGVQVLWFQRSYSVESPIAGGVYAEAVKGPVDTLNPLYAATPAEIAASKLLFSPLLDYDSTGHLRGNLASSVTVDPNGVDFTVTLRQNAKWHDGFDVTVKDIIFTTQLMKDPTIRAVPSLRLAWKDVAVAQLGESAVKFTLPNPNATFLHALNFSVLPEHILKEIQPNLLRESAFSKAPVGSGPFELKRLQHINEAEGRKVIHMSANEKYYLGNPKLERLQLHVYNSDQAIQAALRTYEVTATAELGALEAAAVNSEFYEILAKPVNSGVYAFFNTNQAVLKDKTVRQALRFATDTSALRGAVGGKNLPMDLPFADRQVNGVDVPKAAGQDKAKAAALFDQAGWKLNGKVRTKDGQQLKLHIVTVEDLSYERVVRAIADQWRAVGVDTTVAVIGSEDQAQNSTQAVLQRRDYDVLVNSLLIGADPDVYAYWHSSQASEAGRNLSNYSNSISDTALSSALTKSDSSFRAARYKAFARQWLDDAPAIGIYQTNMYYVHSKNSHTITKDEVIVTPNDRFSGAVNWMVERGTVYTTP